MAETILTMKLHIYPDVETVNQFEAFTERYAEACSFVSKYIFNNGFPLTYLALNRRLYKDLREKYSLKAQMAQSVIKTVIARYKTVEEQLFQKPYKYQDENGVCQYIPRTLEWLRKPILFARPQADLVRNRDYSFVIDKKTGELLVSVNTLEKRARVPFAVPECYLGYFSSGWSFGTAKLVSLEGKWYLHIPMSKETDTNFELESLRHLVGVDRGTRFLATTYDENGKTEFISGAEVMAKRDKFQQVRSELQARGTKSAKRALKRISGRENRWMSDVNHQISKTLVDRYGSGTLFAVENLAGVSFDERNLSNRSAGGRRGLRSWAFYQLEQFLTYKARAVGSDVVKVAPDYTSQRCPKCGRIHKENRRHDTHEYVCDCCGFRSNDDRVGAMNIQFLGTLYASGDSNPRFRKRKAK